jgi:hypothetical protein
MRRGWKAATVGLLGLAVVLLSLRVGAQWEDRFPHERHAGLFPLCIGCHEGIPEGNTAEFYPDPALCTQCHDGQRQPRVEWTGPVQRVTNIEFDHPTHQSEMRAQEGRELDCSACHNQPGSRRMEVERAVVGECLACHAHEARDHYVDADCTTCHLPLARTRFTADRVAGLPRPATHDRPDFLAQHHGVLAESEPQRCSTCHTRELCTSCHVDVPRVTAIADIPGAQPGLGLPTFVARYPVPEDHLHPEWEQLHGPAASVLACSTCHTRESCTSCHVERAPRVVAQLPARDAVVAPGAQVEAGVPESHRSAFFITQHGAVASARPQSCQSCHSASRFCQTCHEPIAQGGEGADAPAIYASLVPADLIASFRRLLPVRSSKASVGGEERRATSEERGSVIPHSAIRTPQSPDTLPRIQTVRPNGAVETTGAQPSRTAGVRQPPRRPARAAEFHPTNYIARHAAESYSRRLECSGCHNTRVFCRDCHDQLGFGAVGRLGPAFHDAQPLWLLRHGQAARQTLESCTTCHAQQDCMQCHSQLGAFQVSPHGRGFDAERARRRNPQVCGACHVGDPMIRRNP